MEKFTLQPPLGTAIGATLRGFPFKTIIFFSSKLMDSLDHQAEIRTFADLRGKIIGVDTPGATTDVITRLLLEKNRLDPSRDLKVLATGHEEIRLEQLKLNKLMGRCSVPKESSWQSVPGCGCLPTWPTK